MGCYGLAAYSIRKDESGMNIFGGPEDPRSVPKLYCPEKVAVGGRCDRVYYFGHQTGDRQGQIVAVIELKIFKPPRADRYHRRMNSALAQIHCSFFGSTAPLGLILGNGVGKAFWRKYKNSKLQLLTYPPGNSMADLTDDEQRGIFCKIFAHVARCSLKMTVDPKGSLTLGKRGIDDTQFKERGESPASSESGDKENSPAGSGEARPRPRNMQPEECVESLDGSLFYFRPYDLSHLTEDERQSLSQRLKEDEAEVSEIWNNKFDNQFVDSQAMGM
jgi:hypothetical protein